MLLRKGLWTLSLSRDELVVLMAPIYAGMGIENDCNLDHGITILYSPWPGVATWEILLADMLPTS